MKALAVEDDPVARLLVEASLRSFGMDVTSVVNGEDALRALAQGSYRLIVSDWSMPVMDGLELCRRVRRIPGDYLYFILLTQMQATPENEDQAIQAGVDDFLPKPVNPRELRRRLHVARRILDYTAQIRQLESFIPICSYCKNVRNDKNYWQQIEGYINERTGSRFSHGICPACEAKVLSDLRAISGGASVRPIPRAEAGARSATPATPSS